MLPQDAQEDFKKGGYYEYILPSGVTVSAVRVFIVTHFIFSLMNCIGSIGPSYFYCALLLEQQVLTNSEQYIMFC